MLSLYEAIIISLTQGLSELFPISSLAHAVLLPRILHWSLNEASPNWLAFLVALHVGTAVALLIYFRDEWVTVTHAFVRSIRDGQIGATQDDRLAWMVVLGTIPAGIIGLALQAPLRSFFSSPKVAAAFLIMNGAIMFVGERLVQRQSQGAMVGETGRDQVNQAGEPFGDGRYRDIRQLQWRDAAIVGLAQVGALIPGISRSGVTMVAGLAAGLNHEAAARYAFLLATPIIAAAGILEVPTLFEPAGRPVLGLALLGAVLAGTAAYLSVRYLMRYFEGGRLYPFAYYCWGAGVLSFILLTLHP